MTTQDELNHDLRNRLSAMSLASTRLDKIIKQAAIYTRIIFEEYEKFKETKKKLEKCRQCADGKP